VRPNRGITQKMTDLKQVERRQGKRFSIPLDLTLNRSFSKGSAPEIGASAVRWIHWGRSGMDWSEGIVSGSFRSILGVFERLRRKYVEESEGLPRVINSSLQTRPLKQITVSRIHWVSISQKTTRRGRSKVFLLETGKRKIWTRKEGPL